MGQDEDQEQHLGYNTRLATVITACGIPDANKFRQINLGNESSSN